MLILFITFALLISSTAMYMAERGTWSVERGLWIRADGSRSPFNSIPGMDEGCEEAIAMLMSLYTEGFYWSMTTLATVGYGDVVPVSCM